MTSSRSSQSEHAAASVRARLLNLAKAAVVGQIRDTAWPVMRAILA